MKNRQAIAACFFLCILISGCAMPPPLNFSVPNVGPSKTKLNAEVKSLTVSLARPDEKTGNLPMGSENIVPMWKSSIEEALDKMAIFRDDSPRKVSLSVKILKVDPPTFGVSMTTETAARYEIIDRRNGGIIFTTDIDAEGTTEGDYAFLGVTRQRESINRAVQNNISKFLMQLETVNLNKPMFPVKSHAQKPDSEASE